MPSPVAQIVYINSSASNSQSVASAINSTKVRVFANVSVHYSVGTTPSAFRANCDVIPANTIRFINMEGVGNKIAFNPTDNVPAEIAVVECGSFVANGVSYPGVRASSLPGGVTD